jgi:hypothetical protein
VAGAGLYVWGGGSLGRARERHAAGATVVAWPGSDVGLLERAGLAPRVAIELIGPEGRAAVVAAERAFARVWARVPLAEGRSFKDLVTWRDESLLWIAEAYLLRSTAGPRCAATVETCLRLLEATDPSEVDASGLAPPERTLLARAATLRGVLFHGDGGRSARPLAPEPAPIVRGPGGLLSRLGVVGRAERIAGPGASVLAIHDAGTRTVLEGLLDRAGRTPDPAAAAVVALDDLPRYETGRARGALAEAERALRATLDRLRGTPGLLASYAHRGVGFADLTALDLEAVLRGHLPQALRLVEQTFDVVQSVRPTLVLAAVGERDRRRAVGLAAKAAGVPWASVSTDPGHVDDRVDGGPQPLARLGPAQDGDLDGAAAGLRTAVRDSLRAR